MSQDQPEAQAQSEARQPAPPSSPGWLVNAVAEAVGSVRGAATGVLVVGLIEVGLIEGRTLA